MRGMFGHEYLPAFAGRIRLLLLFSFILAFTTFAEDEYLHKIWRTEDGLPNPAVRAITQCKTGYLWLGTDDGLSRFDGVQFKTIEARTAGERADRWLVGLVETEDGSIWCSSANGGLVRVQNGESRRYTVTNGLPRDYVLSALQDSKSNLWIGTAGGLARFDSQKFIPYTNQPGLIVEAVRALAEDKTGKLWIGTAKGLSSFDGNKFESFTAENLLVNDSVMALCADSKGILWVGTGAGLTRVENGKPTHFTIKDGLHHDTVRAIHEDRHGQVWIGTQGGIQKFVNGKLESIRLRSISEDFEGITFIYTIFEDREGNLWIGTSIGLNRLQPTKFQSISKDEGLPHNLTTLVCETEPGTLWVGTYGGGLCILRGDQKEVWTTADGGLTSDYILALHQDRSGAMWIGTEGKGMSRFKDGIFTQFLGREVQANTVRVIFEDSQTNLWVGHNLGVSRFEETGLVHHTNFPRTIVKAIIEDRSTNIWVASRVGLTRWFAGTTITYKEGDGLCSDRINSIFQDKEGILWIGTETGLNRMEAPGKFTSFVTTDGPFAEHILDIQEDDYGYLWFSTRNGIIRADKKELNQFARNELPEVHLVSFGRRDGMRRAQCNGIAQPAGWKMHDGRITFPTMHGIVLFNPREIAINKVQPPVIIEEVLVDGIPIRGGQNVKLSPGSKQVEFRYTGLSFQSPDKVRFKYRLEGADTQWEDAGSKRFARFMHLAPGNYTFRVKARNNDGIWSESEAAYSFTLSPHFYQSSIFYALCFAALLGIGVSAHMMRVRNHKERENELAALVNQRTEKLQDMIKSMESYNYSIAHDLRAPIRAIRGFTQALVEDYKPNLDETGCEYAERIERAVERMDQLIQDLLIYGQLSHKEIPLERVYLEPLLERIVDNFSSEIEGKKAQIEIQKPLATVWANNTILHQILSNLLGNALKFVDPKKAPHVQIKTEEHKSIVRIIIQDNGIGIRPDYHERIFRIFERLHPVEVFPGTGIGLAIVQKGTERMGGKVGVKSTFGQGSCFYIDLPRDGEPGKALF